MTVIKKNLAELKNVGKATLQDLSLLGIHSIDQLSECNPTHLFEQLEKKTNSRQDFCVWDVFAAIIHESKTGEALPWWNWTKERKTLQKSGKISHFI